MEINLQGGWNKTSYGIAFSNIAVELIKLGHKISLFPIGNSDESVYPEVYKIGLENAKIYNPQAATLKVWHEWLLADRIGQGKYFGFCFFELDRLRAEAIQSIKSVDHLFLASKWAAGIVNRDSPQTQTSVVPLGVGKEITQYISVNSPFIDKVIFLNIAKYEIRKGHDVLPKIFNQAFSPSIPVELWMLANSPLYTQQEVDKWQRLYMSTPLGKAGKIKFLPRFKTHQEVSAIIQNVDFGIFPSRAEGWNLPVLEMMSLGKKVITTNYSAMTEFCTEENAELIKIEELEMAYDNKFFYGTGMWAKLGKNQIEQAISHMRRLYSDKIQNKDCINHAGIKTGEKLTWKNTAECIVKELT